MPEITDAQFREYGQYTALGTPEDVGKKLRDLDKVKSEAADRRKAAAELETKVADLEKKVPEGAVVLTGDEAKAYEAIQAAGGLKEASKRLEGLEELKKKDERRTREDGIGDAAEAEGWDRKTAVKALTRDAEFGGLPFEVKEIEREVQAGGKTEKRTVKAGFVTVDGKSIPLGEWVQKNADHILPSLTANGGTQNNQGGGREYVAQSGRSQPQGAKKTDEDFAKATDATANYTL